MYADTSPAFVSMIGSAVSEPRTELVAELRRALEQAAVEVEDVAGVRLAARRAPQQQRDLAVRLGLLRQVVVDDERVLAVLHPVLAHRAAGVRGEVLERRFVGGRARSRRPCTPSRRARERRRRSARRSSPSGRSRRRCTSRPDPSGSGSCRWRSVVLPVLRSPMMSSRWPRPIGVIASMALMPVCSGSCTGWRPDDAGRLHFDRRVWSSRSGPCRRSGCRARSRPGRSCASPTGTERMRPVALTVCLPRSSSTSPRMTAPIDSSSRFSARPSAAALELEDSLTATPGRPATRAMPSPTSSTRPTCALERRREGLDVLAQAPPRSRRH